jgi:benzoyl-CoA reductase/2-hydroxyglutaryl-CoA dehydratase subunit BcrC/BadD/HgdB
VPEIFYAMNVIPYMPESFGGLMASMGYSTRSLDKAYSMGFSRDSCTLCNHVIGAYMYQQLPKPDMIISTMFTLCDAQGKAFEIAAKELNVPFQLIHLPTINDTPYSQDFFVGELRHLVAVLELLTGKRLTKEALIQSIEWSNLAIDYFRKFLDERKRMDVPIKGLDAFYNYFPLYNYLGDQKKVTEFYKELSDELQTIPDSKLNGEKKIRLLNAGHYFPLHDSHLMKDLEDQNVTFVSEYFSQLFWKKVDIDSSDSLDDVISKLAARCLDLPTTGSIKRRVEICRQLAVEWSVDGAVIFVPWGCRVIAGGAYAFLDYLRTHLHIPTLILDSDPLDESIYAKGPVKTRLNAFIEMLRTKKGYRL